MILVENYSKVIKKNLILDKINLKLDEGKCYGFVGHNGCGKTMLLRAICGYIKPDEGMVEVDDVSMSDNYLQDAGIILGEPQFLGGYTATENLEVLAAIRKVAKTERINELLEYLDLDKSKKFRNYSLGMKQKLRIAFAFMEDPKYLILDEPFNALDKKSVGKVEDMIEEAKKQGKTVLLTSHDERNIEKLCDEIIEMEEGRIINEE